MNSSGTSSQADVTPTSAGRRTAEEGLQRCRQGDWRRGFDLLTQVAANKQDGEELPSAYYSYLGYGVARFDRRFKDGVTLCRHAIKLEFYQPENYLNLARTYMLLEDRRHAFDAVRSGLRIDPGHRGLRQMLRELGHRRRPVLGFLARDNPVNVLLGRVRYALRKSRASS